MWFKPPALGVQRRNSTLGLEAPSRGLPSLPPGARAAVLCQTDARLVLSAPRMSSVLQPAPVALALGVLCGLSLGAVGLPFPELPVCRAPSQDKLVGAEGGRRAGALLSLLWGFHEDGRVFPVVPARAWVIVLAWVISSFFGLWVAGSFLLR